MMTLERAASAALPMVDEDDLRAELLDEVKVAGSQKTWAAAHGVTPQYLHDVLNARRMISPEFARLIGHERLVVYIRKCPLDATGEVQP